MPVRFQSIVERMSDGLLVLVRSGACLYLNPAGEALLGRSLSHARGRPWRELLDPPHREGLGSSIERALAAGATGSPGSPESIEYGEPEGRRFAATVDDQGAQIVVTLRDATERARERRLADEANAMRERLLGIVSHDLRNPAAGIAMAAGALLRRKALADRDRRLIASIGESAERMHRMIAQLLDVARIRQGGGVALALGPSDLAAICSQVIDEISLARPGSAIALAVRGDTRGSWDADRLARAISNLVGNALQHGAEAPVSVRVGPAGDDLVVEVHNRGAPIPEAVLPVIFDPFRRGLDGARYTLGEGLGLGLYIAREIAVAHGGGIQVRSPDGDGTTFVLRVPRTPRA